MLVCTHPYSAVYQGERIKVEQGSTVDDAQLEAFLLADSPDSFRAIASIFDAAMAAPSSHRAMTNENRAAAKAGQVNDGAMGVADHPGLRSG